MKITVCRCPVCGSANISSLAWVAPNSYAGGVTRKLGMDDFKFNWADRDGCVVCDDCDEESDYWDEEELEGEVTCGKAFVKDENGNLVSIYDWCAAHPYDMDEEDREEE